MSQPIETDAQPWSGPLQVGAMQVSVPCDKVFGALAVAQGKMGRVLADKTAKVKGQNRKTGQSYDYSYSYADLSSVLAAAKAALTEAGLALIQTPTVDSGRVVVTTMLAHGSGQWVASTITFTGGGDIQAMGSAITYLRRYAATAMLGLAPEDDDGQAAMPARGGQSQGQRPPTNGSRVRPPANNSRPNAPSKPQGNQAQQAPDIDAERKRTQKWFFSAARAAGVDASKLATDPKLATEMRRDLQEAVIGLRSLSQATFEQLGQVRGRLPMWGDDGQFHPQQLEKFGQALRSSLEAIQADAALAAKDAAPAQAAAAPANDPYADLPF